jgi:hypothetical protein
METQQLGRWLRRLRGTATFVSVTALCLAVAVAVIAFIPGSPVSLGLPTDLLWGRESLGGTVPGVVVDPAGEVVFTVTDPSLPQRLLHLATTLPGLLLVAEIARRMAGVLRAAQDSDPFTARTARELTLIAKITAVGGLGVWAVDTVAEWVLSATMLDAGAAVAAHQSLAGWLAVAFIFAAFAQLVARGVTMRAELDTLI